MAEPQTDRTRATPSFVASPAAPRVRAGAGLWLANGVLLAAFAVIWLLAGRATLAQDARTRPVAERACAWLGCSLPAWRDARAFRMLQHDIHADPARPGVLRVAGGFRNEARWPQAWPDLVLTLSDAGGRPLARRALTPAEYLGATHPPHIEAGQTASVQFAVREPARNAVSFGFEFRNRDESPIQHTPAVTR